MTERLSELLLAWEEDEATAEQLDELAALLEADSNSRQRAVAHFELSAALAEQLHEAQYTQSVADEVRAMARQDSLPRKASSGNRLAWVAAVLVLIASGAVAYYVDLSAWLPRFGDPFAVPQMPSSPANEQPVLLARRGIVRVGNATALEVGERAVIGSTVETESESYATLRYEDGSTLELSPSTCILLEHGAGKHLSLERGALFACVAPQPAKAPLTVNPGRFDQVTVVGTEFELRCEPSGEAIVRVARGTVKFGRDAHALAVSQQQESRINAGQNQPAAPQAVTDGAIWQGWQRGLTGEYFRNGDLRGDHFTRIDSQIDFNWGDGAPDPSIAGDFSIRWTGEIEPPHTGEFVFTTEGYYGVRLWVDGQLLINSTASMGSRENTRPLRLEAGRRYPIRIEYLDRQRHARMRLWWSSDEMPQTIVDRRWLHPAVENHLASP